jgi:hypothetical protein
MNGNTINQRLGKYKFVFNQEEANAIVRQLLKYGFYSLGQEQGDEEPPEDLVWLCSSCHYPSHDFTTKVDREAYKNLIALADPEDCVFITVRKSMLEKINVTTRELGYHSWQEKWGMIDHLLDCAHTLPALFRKR